jgi:hypothetical protein
LGSSERVPVGSFLALSRMVTGFSDLDAAIGRRYLARLLGSPYEPGLRKALGTFDAADSPGDRQAVIRTQLESDESVRVAIIQVVLLWYTSAIQDDPKAVPLKLRYGEPGEYFSAVGWKVIGAHIPGLSGGYFGHWRYPPENQPP